MAVPVLILGESGTGKSASLRNFKNSEVAVVNVAGKPLPFKNSIESVTTDNYMTVERKLKELAKTHKSLVVDDAQYLMANEFMRRATERGFDKFTEIAKNFWELINMVSSEMPKDTIVYFLAHIERDQNGNEKIKTIGKLLDEKITVEGMFTIVLKTNVTDSQYSFLTQNNGHDTVKSPIGMFPSYAIDNDLKYVDDKIRNYYEMGEFLSDEDIEAADKKAKKEDIVPEQKKEGRRGRKKTESETAVEKSGESNEAVAEEKQKTRTRKKRDESSDAAETPEAADDAAVSETEENKPARRRGRRQQEADAAKQLEKDVADALVESETEEVPFDEAPEPPVPETPTRRRRKRA